jgi:hypothetical protein
MLPVQHVWAQVKSWWPLWLVYALGALAIAPLWQFYPMENDEGMILASAMKVVDGQVMYRDFFEFWTPGTVYLMGWIMKLFGPDLHVIRIVYVISTALLICAYFLVARRSGLSPKMQAIVVGLYAFIGAGYLSINHHWYGALGMLSTVWLLQAYTREYKYSYAAWSGLVAGLTAMFMQYEGVAAIVTGIIAIVICTPRALRLSRLSVFLGASALLMMIVIIFFAAQGGLQQLLYSTIIFPLFQYKSVNNHGFNALWVAEAMLLVLFYATAYKKAWVDQRRLVLIVGATAMIAVNVTTASYMHVLISAHLFICLMAIATMRLRVWWQVRDRCLVPSFWMIPKYVFLLPIQRFSAIVLNAILLSIFTAIVMFVMGSHWVSLYMDPKFTAITPVGTVRILQENNQRIEYLHRISNQYPKNTIYYGPYSSHYFYLFQRPNPLGYSQLTPYYNPDWMLRHAATQLDSSHVDIAIIMPDESVFGFHMNNIFYQSIVREFQNIDMVPGNKSHLTAAEQKTEDPPNAVWIRKDLAVQ